jgi:UrcA family protein
MTGLYCIRAATAAVCLTVSVTAVAQNREPVTAQVGYADLNLATAAGQAAFKTRIHHVALQSCVSAAVGLDGYLDRSRCMREMQRDGDTRLAALITQSTTELASGASARGK